MIINLSIKQYGSVLPDVKELLLSDIQVPLFYAVYGLRHPLAIYNVSCATVLGYFSKTITLLLQVIKERTFLIKSKKDGSRELLENLLDSQRDLLYALMEYLEDCDSILACFFPSKDIRNKNTYVKLYRKATEEYRDHIGKVVNYLKHNQGRLRSITFYNDVFALPGYFVVGPTGESSLGPVEMIHSDGNTAFSFARDLRYNLFHFYAVAQHLSNAIGGILSSERDYTSSKSETPDERVLEIASGISSLPLMFYPDEVLKPVPSVIILQDHTSDTTITLTYPDHEMRVDVVPRGMKVIADHVGDGVTRSFRFPYMGKKDRKA